MRYIYLINVSNTDLYKIGFTKQSPIKRVKDLQTGNPLELTLIDYYESDIAHNIESAMHNFLIHKKNDSQFGVKLIGEWFSLDKKDVEDFKKNCKTIEEGLSAIKKGTLFS